jgi:tetratricopeptide (TPR) repeat protein
MMRQFDDAIAAYQLAIQISDDSDGAGVASAARSNMANVYNEQGRIDEALPLYWEDVRVCRESDPPQPYHQAITLANIGAALAKAERYAGALSPLRDAMNIRRDLDDQPGIASTAENLGGVLSRLAAMRTIGAISRKQLNCFRRLPRSIGNGATFGLGGHRQQPWPDAVSASPVRRRHPKP